MSQYDDDDDFDFDDEGDGSIKSLRAALRKEKAARKAAESELVTFRTEARKNTIAKAIESKGLNPKIAAFVPKDIEIDALASWLDEYGDVFAPQAPAAPEGEQEPAPEPPAGAATFQQVTSAGSAPTGDESQILAALQSANTMEEWNRLVLGR